MIVLTQTLWARNNRRTSTTKPQTKAASKKGTSMKNELVLNSSFKNGQPLRSIYALKGGNEAPTLEWSNVPSGTKSFVLIVDDPDAPGKTWVHWVVYNIPAEKTELSASLGNKRKLADGTMQGKNDFNKTEYDGPNPPPGKPHRYFFKLYALDTMLTIQPGATKAQVEAAMEGHQLGSAQLIGTYAQ